MEQKPVLRVQSERNAKSMLSVNREKKRKKKK